MSRRNPERNPWVDPIFLRLFLAGVYLVVRGIGGFTAFRLGAWADL